MQAVRLNQNHPRDLSHKIYEVALAAYWEMALSKKEILLYYLNNLSFGQNIIGIAQASEVFFKKQVRDLSLGETAFLLAKIRAPSRLNANSHRDQLLALQQSILQHAVQNGFVLAKKALPEKLVIYEDQRFFKAPHFTQMILDQGYASGDLVSTLDSDLQKKVQSFVQKHLEKLMGHHVTQASVLVVENKSGAIRAYLGSKDYFSVRDHGFVDGVRQSRQPGSSLKPFAYLTALQKDFSPHLVLPDVPLHFESPVGSYQPENYDRLFRGPVLMRVALASSLNVPAVALLDQMGVMPFYNNLKRLGFSNLSEEADHYGLGLVLGNVEVSLWELVRAYSVFANDGQVCELRFLEDNKKKNCVLGDAFFDANDTRVIRDFLSDNRARSLAFGSESPFAFDFPVMVKTGTSQGFRDNITIALTPTHTIGVWVGNFDGTAMNGVSGVTGAGPIASEIVHHLYLKNPWGDFQKPALKKQILCALSGQTPGEHCSHVVAEYTKPTESLDSCSVHRAVTVSREDGSRVCAQDQNVSHKVIWDLPAVYNEWLLENHRDKVLPSFASECLTLKKDSFAKQGTELLSPKDGSRFRLDRKRPRAAQELSVQLLKRTQGPVRVLLDQNELSAPYRFVLQEGAHQIIVQEKQEGGWQNKDRAAFFVQ
ncbi:MAG: transglycosylase domain-containing protein [Deltaproteobacteria bacterium]|nr:transglycosylase domain-containing protein [Deltaproteobacteria bacterium]